MVEARQKLCSVRRLDLWVLIIVIALGSWFASTRRQTLALSWSISRNQDGSDGCAISLNGNQLSGPKGVRTLTEGEIEQIGRVVDDAGVLESKSAKSDLSPSLYTQARIRRHGQSIELHWAGLGSMSQMHVVDALLNSPLGPELHQCILTARSPLEERETRRREAVLTERHIPRCPLEVLLESVEAQRLLPLLEYAYPNVRLQAHPTMNGFYLAGPLNNVLHLKNQIPNLDRRPFLQTPTTSDSAKVGIRDEWSPKNSHVRFRGSRALREALINSRSVVSETSRV